jgi:hypothetical protein
MNQSGATIVRDKPACIIGTAMIQFHLHSFQEWFNLFNGLAVSKNSGNPAHLRVCFCKWKWN